MRIFAITILFATAIGSTSLCGLRAQEANESLSIDDLKPHFELQFHANEELSYPLFEWSTSTKKGALGFVETDKLQSTGAGISHPYAIKFVVTQRLSDREALIEARVENHNPLLGLTSSRSNGLMLMRTMQRPYQSFDFAFVGFDFANVADQSEFEFKGGIKCVGIYEYLNTRGAKTSVPRIQRVTFPEIPHPATLGFGVRTWSDRTGTFSVSACFDAYQSGIVTLIKESDGTTIEVKLSTLSSSDQKWVREWLREIREAEKLKATAERK